ncbi:MAG TPA: agmatine deiminase family protein [Gammaproteobacteria bacterium]
MYHPKKNFIPAEWHPQDGVILTWPHPDSDWAEVLQQIEPEFVSMAAATSRFENVLVICREPAHEQHIRGLLASAGKTGIEAKAENIRYAHIKTNDTWSRDFGPISIVRDGQPQLLDFKFNGWGGRYPAELDNAVNGHLRDLGFFATELQPQNFILEGGSIESDGAGTLLTTRRCLLNDRRNPGDLDALTRALLDYLPVQRVLWLEHGMLLGDDTDSHIDNLARFVAEDTLVYLQCEDPSDEHHEELHAMAAELTRFRTPGGAPYKLVPLPMPRAIFSRVDSRRLPASYVNFLIINEAVLVPQFNDPADEVALRTLEQCFPDRRMIGIDSRGFVEQNGGIHCLTMQVAAGGLKYLNH